MKDSLNQFDNVFNVLMKAHQQHNDLFEGEKKDAYCKWFDEIDEKVFSFKYRTFNLIRENGDDQKSNSSSKSRSLRLSKRSSKCRKSSILSK